MLSNFAKSAESVFYRLAIKKVCKFLLKKKLGQLILGDIDLNQLDVQLSNGTIQLSDLALNVDFINKKFGEAAVLVVKEGSIGSLTVRLPWKRRNCEIEVEELEIVLAPGRKRSSQAADEPSTSGQDSNTYTSHGFTTPEQDLVNSTMTNPSVDIHEGVKTIAKMVKWLLTSFHVKIKKMIVALDPFLEEPKEKGFSRTLVLRIGEVQCGTGISEDVDLDSQRTVDGFLGLSQLTNFLKFDGAVLEFLQLDDFGNKSAFPCTPVITGEKGGFSGTIKLSIPWKNGSLDIRKLDADVFIDPLEIRLQPSSLKSFMYLMHVFEELENDHKSFMDNKPNESVYYNASFHGYSSEFSSDKPSQKPETESYLDALLRGSHLISDWMTSPVTSNLDTKTEEPDIDASVDQFFECFDELRTSQSALGNSGMWNWTCSVFSAITAASNLASGSLHIPSEQKHVETSLKARITHIVILFSFVDEDKKPSCIHYINADFHEMQLMLQVCPRESNFEASINHIEVADHFSNTSDSNVKTQDSLIRKKQAAVEGACPPLSFQVQSDSPNVSQRGYRGIYSDDVAKVLILKTSGVTQCQFITPTVSQDVKSQPKSFSIKLPPLVFWVNFHLITTVLDLFKEIEKSREIYVKKDLSASISGDINITPNHSHREVLRGNIFLLDARMVLCFPCEKNQNQEYKTYLSWNEFIVIDFFSPLPLGKVKSSQRFRVTPSRSFHLSVGNISVYFVNDMQNLKFRVERVLSVFDKTGHPSVFSMIFQDNAVTGPWITKKAKILSTSDGTTSRNKSTGKGHGFAFVTTTKDLEDFNTQTREEMVLTSSFFIHARLSPVTINLNSSLYQNIHNLSHQITDWLSHISPNQVPTTQKHSSSQSSIFLECNLVEISVAMEGMKDSIRNELPGSWCNLKLKVGNFELLTVSNTGGICGASFLWVGHGEGDLLGSTTEVSGKNFLLISCENSTKGRGNGEGSNILSSRLPGSDIIHMWDPQTFMSQVSINIRCATIVAIGGRLDWFDAIISFFSQTSTESDQKEDTISGSSFVLNLIDIGLSYEPYSSNPTSQQDSEPRVSGFLASSSLKLSNVSSPNSVQKEYEIKGHDLGLLLCEESGVKNLERSYSEQNLRRFGYVKVAEETHIEAVLRTNCVNGHEWEMECHESHIVLETCQDSTSGLARLAAQIQQIFAPDVEESIVHLQTRWDDVQMSQESCKSRSSSHHSASSSSEFHETYTVNLMDEISEGAFDLNESHEFVPPVKVPFQMFGLEDSGLEFIDGYFNNQSSSGKTVILKETEGQVGSGWYGDSLLTIVEDHVFGNGEKTKSKHFVESGPSKKVEGRVVLKNMDVRWTLYGGSHWQYTTDSCMRNKDIGLEFKLSKMGFQYDMFPDGEITVSKLSVSIQDLCLDDVSNRAPWRQILGCYQSKDRPRESCSRALKFDLESVRPHPSIPLEEYRLQISVLPIRLHLHQSQLEFLINFFGGKNSSPDHSQETFEIDLREEALLPYFQKFSITPVVVRVDYIPSRVDLPALGHGKYVELVNLFQWKGVELQLKNVQAVGVYGWSSVCETIIGQWLEDISQNQVHKLLKGLPPIRSLVAIGSSAAKLVSLPVKNYKKDRRLVKGMQRGTIGFLRSVSLEAIGLGAHLAAGVHAILLQAEEIISTTSPTSIPRPIQTRVNPYGRPSQPKDARQGIQQAFETMSDGIGRSASALVQAPLKKYQRGAGVGSALSTAVQAAPGAAIAPASAAARAVHSALLGVRNSLDPEHKKDSMDKYLGTTQSQPL
ncbi:hypothetical protein Lser_V15G45805 [Lactuca serriola]